MVAIGQLARIVNYYDGPKRPKSLSEWPTIGTTVVDLHHALHRYAAVIGVDLASAVERKLDGIPIRDAGRFPPSKDPATSMLLRMFDETRTTSPCPYAMRSRLWAAPPWAASLSDGENLGRAAEGLRMFVRAARHEDLDAFVVGGVELEFRDFGSLSVWFARILQSLAQADRDSQTTLLGLYEPGWQFAFEGQRLFISVFSSLYSDRHPRRCVHGTYVLLQPEESFSSHGISGGAVTSSAKRNAREAFLTRGFEYPSELIDARYEPAIYLLPEGDSFPSWWKLLDLG